MADPTLRDRILGCLFGGAIGDALGAPVEFLPLEQIRDRYGPEGITDFDVAYGRKGAVTDDTQMTLFTVEGLIRAGVRSARRWVCDPVGVVHHAYMRWLLTQGVEEEDLHIEVRPDGWLIAEEDLWHRRAPGNTCLSALRSTTRKYGVEAQNDSKGCGGVMRIAPVGLVGHRAFHPDGNLFGNAAAMARVTHGHPSGYLAAGALAEIIACLTRGQTLLSAVNTSLEILRSQPEHHEVSRAVLKAIAATDGPSTKTLERLGQGWVAEEALAMSLYCALSEPDPTKALILAVNHSGDSDSTGCITGQILGTMHGVEALPREWIEQVELREVIGQLGEDLALLAEGPFDAEAMLERYPGW